MGLAEIESKTHYFLLQKDTWISQKCQPAFSQNGPSASMESITEQSSIH